MAISRKIVAEKQQTAQDTVSLATFAAVHEAICCT
jgi:hypothetical protein